MRLIRTLQFSVFALGLIAAVSGQAATPPTVTTLAATNVASASATLKALVNPNGATTLAWLEWGPGNALRFKTTPTNIGSGTSASTISVPISNLTASVIYNCRAVASNSLGIVRSLTLPFGVPTVTLSGAAIITNAMFAPFNDPGASASALPTALAVGDSYALVLKADGFSIGWGQFTDGRTNIQTTLSNLTAVAASYDHSLGLTKSGAIVGWGTNDIGQLNPPSDATNIIAIAAGSQFSLALRNDGVVLGWGLDDLGQVDVPPEATNVIAIAAGFSHSVALCADGTVLEWGEFASGFTTGAPPEATNVVAVAAGYSHTIALRADGTVVTWGSDSLPVVTIPSNITNIIAIAGGFAHSLALRADGTLLGWGQNTFNELSIPAGLRATPDSPCRSPHWANCYSPGISAGNNVGACMDFCLA
jgi:alpha-tubulin suppressor-like RCC1 family protein